MLMVAMMQELTYKHFPLHSFPRDCCMVRAGLHLNAALEESARKCFFTASRNTDHITSPGDRHSSVAATMSVDPP